MNNTTIGAVVISRNDGYGGDQPDKAIYSLTSMIAAMDEVIYVDWNSPDDVTLFSVIKDRLPKTGKLRAITVNNALHHELTNHSLDVQNCVEVLARNIGLRRLTTEYKTSANADIMVLSRASIEAGIRGPATFHCIARRETPFHSVFDYGHPGSDSILVGMNVMMPHFNQHHDGSPLGPGDPWSLITCPGDFQLAHRDIWDAIRGFEESLIMRGYSDSNVQKKAALAGFNLALIRDIPVFHFQHYPDTGACGGNTAGWNDRYTSLDNFTHTTNPDIWGFADREFPTEIL